MTPKSKSKWYFLPFMLFLLTANLTAQICTDYSERPGTIPNSSGGVAYNTFINVPNSFTITDVKTVNNTHTWKEVIDVFLIATIKTKSQKLFKDNSFNLYNYRATFDEPLIKNILTVNPTINGTYAPEGSLSDFNAENSAIWTIDVIAYKATEGITINSETPNIYDNTPANTLRYNFECSLDGWTNTSSYEFNWLAPFGYINSTVISNLEIRTTSACGSNPQSYFADNIDFDRDEVDLSLDTDNDAKAKKTFVINGIDNSLATDNYLYANINDPTILPDIDGDVLTIGDVNYRVTHLSGTPLIKQILQTSSHKVKEINNTHPTYTFLGNNIKLSLFNDKSESQKNETPNTTYYRVTNLIPGASILLL